MIYAGALAAGAFAGQHVVLFGHQIDSHFWGVRRDVARRDDRLHRRLDHRLGDRLLRRPAARRATRPLAPSRAREPRPRRTLVRALGRLGGLPRSRHAGRPLVRLDPGRASRACRSAATRLSLVLGDLVLRARGRRAGRSARATRRFHHDFRYVDYARRSSRIALRRASRWYRAAAAGVPTRLARRASIPLVDVKAQYAPLLDELKERIAEVLDSGRFILGPNVQRLRGGGGRLPRRAEHAIGVANGTDALVLVARRAGDRARRRGDLPGVHVLRDRRGDRAARRHAGLRGHRPADAEPRPGRRRARRITPTDEGDHAGAPLRPAGAARRARRRSASRSSRTRRRPSARRASRTHRRRLDLQLLPDEEPLRARRRRPRRDSTDDGARRARAAAPLPRLEGEEGLRARRLQLAARRAAGRRAAALPAARSTSGTARGARRRRATPSSGWARSASCPADEPGHVYHMYVVRSPERDRIAAAPRGGRDRVARRTT